MAEESEIKITKSPSYNNIQEKQKEAPDLDELILQLVDEEEDFSIPSFEVAEPSGSQNKIKDTLISLLKSGLIHTGRGAGGFLVAISAAVVVPLGLLTGLPASFLHGIYRFGKALHEGDAFISAMKEGGKGFALGVIYPPITAIYSSASAFEDVTKLNLSTAAFEKAVLRFMEPIAPKRYDSDYKHAINAKIKQIYQELDLSINKHFKKHQPYEVQQLVNDLSFKHIKGDTLELVAKELSEPIPGRDDSLREQALASVLLRKIEVNLNKLYLDYNKLKKEDVNEITKEIEKDYIKINSIIYSEFDIVKNNKIPEFIREVGDLVKSKAALIKTDKTEKVEDKIEPEKQGSIEIFLREVRDE